MRQVRKDISARTFAGSREKLQGNSEGILNSPKFFCIFSVLSMCLLFHQNNESKLERSSTATDRQISANARSVGPPTVPCKVCGRNFGTRSIKIHEPQCNRRWQAQNGSMASHRNQPDHHSSQSTTSNQRSPPSMYPVMI